MKTQLQNTFKSTLKVAHKNLPAIPDSYVPVPGTERPKLKPPVFGDATRDENGNRINHSIKNLWLLSVKKVL